MNLRPYQIDALERASEASATANGILLVMPTGTGKTCVAVEACARHEALGGECLFVTPRRELQMQANRALARRGTKRSIAMTIQQLTVPGVKILPASLVVLDEARHYVADEWGKIRDALPDALFLGLDATPARGDDRGLVGMFDVLIEAINIRDAVDGRYLVPCDTIRPDRSLGPGELAQHPVDAYLEHAPGTSAVLFAPTVALAYEYAARFRDRGVRAAGIDGEMPIGERDYCLSEYERGELKVLCNVALLTEGWDAPHTETVILAGACGTTASFLQRVGRGMRLYPGKSKMTLLDLRGVSHIFGDVDEPRTWHLEGKAVRRAKDDIEVRFCPVCGSPTETTECDACGYSGELRKRKPKVLGLPMDRFAREHAMNDEQAAKGLAGYLRVARSRGYRPGWAYRCFAHKYGRPVTTEIKRLAARLG